MSASSLVLTEAEDKATQLPTADVVVSHCLAASLEVDPVVSFLGAEGTAIEVLRLRRRLENERHKPIEIWPTKMLQGRYRNTKLAGTDNELSRINGSRREIED